MFLMCKDAKVYDIGTERVITQNLLPGYMRKVASGETFDQWMRMRYSATSNSNARLLKGKAYGQMRQKSMNKGTHALSLSDCYWLSENGEEQFAYITPYQNKFWQGESEYFGGAIPTCYVPGALVKRWISAEVLVKPRNQAEFDCWVLCRMLEVSCNRMELADDALHVWNFTNQNTMLEQANASGDFSDFDEVENEQIIEKFGQAGLDMLVIEALVSNVDRHPGNFGWLRDANSGAYLGMSPLYDFDMALMIDNPDNLLTREIIGLARGERKARIVELCERTLSNDVNPGFKENAKAILAFVQGA